jgi:hypothetical protein
MRELGIMPSAFAREPLAPLGEASAARVRELLGDLLATAGAAREL